MLAVLLFASRSQQSETVSTFMRPCDDVMAVFTPSGRKEENRMWPYLFGDKHVIHRKRVFAARLLH